MTEKKYSKGLSVETVSIVIFVCLLIGILLGSFTKSTRLVSDRLKQCIETGGTYHLYNVNGGNYKDSCKINGEIKLK